MSRLEFTAKTMRLAYERSGGICECHLIPHVFDKPCGLPLGDGNTFYEHVEPDNIKPDNSLENCAALTKACWRIKTSRYDRKVIAKSNHTRDRARGIKSGRSSFRTNRDQPFKKKMSGEIVRRQS